MSEFLDSLMNKEGGPTYEPSPIRYVVVEGVIGAGKTALAQLLNNRLPGRLILEEFENNPFLEKFYQDPNRFAFQTQMFFLINRFKQQQGLQQEHLFEEYIISDYLFEKDRIFAYLTLAPDELAVYETVFPLLKRQTRKPDLIIYLQSSIDRLMANIRLRNRRQETKLEREYIERLNEAYNRFFFLYQDTPLLIVHSSTMDFVKNEADFEEIYRAIFRDDRGFLEYVKPVERKK